MLCGMETISMLADIIKKIRSGAVIRQINRDKTGYDVDGISYYFKCVFLQRFHDGIIEQSHFSCFFLIFLLTSLHMKKKIEYF